MDPRIRDTRRGRALAAAGVMALLALPGAASAGTVAVSSTTITFTAAPGEQNDLVITFVDATNTYTFVDSGAPVTAGTGCAQVANAATCVLAGATQLAVQLGDRDDTLDASTITTPIVVDGGDGTENIATGPGADRVDCGRGDDRVRTGTGADTVNGGDGDDTLTAGATADGADSFTGGSGFDEINYRDRTAAVAVTLNDTADDGEAGEGDDIHSDVEGVRSGAGNDTLVGTATKNRLIGGAGDDTLQGLAGDDSLIGEEGRDALGGGPGDDQLEPGDGDDTANGDAGSDFIFPSAGADASTGGPGFDSIFYFDRGTGVQVSLDGVANDGNAGENDNVAPDIESIFGSDFDDVLIGTGGRQVLDGSSGTDVIRGGDGSDRLVGGSGDDQLNGGSGDDELHGDVGADDLLGGSGEDEVIYAERELAVTVSLDDRADDGETAEGDNVHRDVENVVGGNGDDRIVGNAADNFLTGGRGDDRIRGGRGSDELVGGPGADRLTGGAGRDTIAGGAGRDTVLVRDRAADDVSCGAGFDRVATANRVGPKRDRLSPDCEVGGAV